MKMRNKRRPAPEPAVRSYGERLMMVPPDALVPFARNARTHSKKQIRQIADSIGRFGFTNPVLIDDDNMILAGHGRVAAAKLLEVDEVPCLKLGDMSEGEKRAYILADNKIAQNAGWDEDILAIELEYLLSEVDDIDLSMTGFSVSEVDLLLETGETGTPAADAADDRLPAPAEEAVTRRGDVLRPSGGQLGCQTCVDACLDASGFSLALGMWSGAVVWTTGDRLHRALALSAIRKALVMSQPAAGLIHHSDPRQPILCCGLPRGTAPKRHPHLDVAKGQLLRRHGRDPLQAPQIRARLAHALPDQAGC